MTPYAAVPQRRVATAAFLALRNLNGGGVHGRHQMGPHFLAMRRGCVDQSAAILRRFLLRR